MSIIEICLLGLGIVTFVVSFIIPERKRGSKDNIPFDEAQLNEMVDKQIKEAKTRLEGVVSETLDYAIEKTERTVEKISNEKIMAVNEYSDTVLDEINKNHKEVMFLYDMLNDKHKNVTQSAIEVDKKAKVARETAIEAEEKVLEVKKQAQLVNEVTTQQTVSGSESEKKTAIELLQGRQQTAQDMIKMLGAKRITRPTATEVARKSDKDENVTLNDIQLKPLATKKVTSQEHILADYKAKVEGTMKQNQTPVKETEPSMSSQSKRFNNNEKILQLHKQGKTNVAIAKELGLGVGEVTLVLNLYKGA